MIIRVIAILSLVSMTILVLYLPAANAPHVFIEKIRDEHHIASDFWGGEHAVNIMRRMLSYHEATPKNVPLMNDDSRQQGNVNSAVSVEVGSIGARIFENRYFKSLNTLLALGEYRMATLLEWMPALTIFLVASLLDGGVRRIVKSKEFLPHSPEIYSLCTCLCIVAICGTVVAFVLPVTLPPLLLPSVPFFIGMLANLALANYHRAA